MLTPRFLMLLMALMKFCFTMRESLGKKETQFYSFGNPVVNQNMKN
jgi:hypothetical protein